MVIFVTDEGRFWNHENPILEKYSKCVVVVCLNGKAVTDKYRCVVSPYESLPQLGMTDYSILSHKYKALRSIGDKLREEIGYHDDIVFLTDQEPQSLYPYLVLKDEADYNRIHLWCMAPWKFERQQRQTAFFEFMHDLDRLTSIHYVDADEFLKSIDKGTTLKEAINKCGAWLNSMLPGALYEINQKMKTNERYYYDVNAKRYISTKNSYSTILKIKPISKKEIEKFVSVQEFIMMGDIVESFFPEPDQYVKDAVEQLHPRLDGKQVCETLKQMRIQLAEANKIKFDTVNCPSTGPCAGTCERCDMELRYLQKELLKKKETDRRYPQSDIKTKRIGAKVSYDGQETIKRASEKRSVMGLMRHVEKRWDPVMDSSGIQIPSFLKKVIERDAKGGESNE